MKTYLIPIDFSEAAYNAARFAAKLSKQTDTEHIVLMNAYYISSYETLLPDPDMLMLREQEIEESAAERMAQLEELKAELQKEVRTGVKIHIRLNRTHLVRAVVDVVTDDNVDLVFIGSKGNSSVGQAGLGSHVIQIAKTSPAPVMVVPPSYRYQLIENAVIACDFKQVTENVPMQILHKLLGKQLIKLMVVNIDNDNKHATAEQQAEETALHSMLRSYHPRYYYVNSPSVIKGILDFAGMHQAQMIIALPHKYSFLQSIVHSSISQQLASNSNIPVLLLK